MLLRFHCDENINSRLITGLLRQGIDVTSTKQAGLLRHPDESQLAYICRVGRVLITHDQDFLVLDGQSHPGIYYCKQTAMSIGEMIEFSYLAALTTTPDQIMNRVEYMKRL